MTDHRPSPVPVLKDLLWSSTPRKLVTIVIIGLFIRYFVGLFFTHPTDINYWVLVTENYISGADMFSLPGYYYTPVWGYFLSVISAIAGFTGIPLGEYVPDLVAGSMAMDWKITLPSLSYALLVKSFLFLFDVLAAIVLYRIGRVVFDEKRAILMFAVWFLCPFTIIISSIRIMFENLEILFMLLSLLMMLKRRPAWAGVMMGLSLMTKPYGMFLAILMMGYSYAQARSVKYTVTYVVTTLVAGLSVMIPILLSGQLDESLIWLTSRAGSGGSGYSVSLYLMPSLVVIAVVISFLMAFFQEGFVRSVGRGGDDPRSGYAHHPWEHPVLSAVAPVPVDGEVPLGLSCDVHVHVHLGVFIHLVLHMEQCPLCEHRVLGVRGVGYLHRHPMADRFDHRL